jgi:hypothetical protein
MVSVLVRFTEQSLEDPKSWYMPISTSGIPTTLNPENMPEEIIKALASHHHRPHNPSINLERWTLGKIVLVWKGFSEMGAETNLVGIEEEDLERLVGMMAQREWRDYIHITYIEN